MHLFFFIRGINNQVELFKTIAQNHFWKWRRTNILKNKEEIILIQGGLRPSVFGAYEYIFPKEALPEVLAIFGITSNESYGFKKITLKARHYIMRKVFNCKPIPKKILDQVKNIPESIVLDNSERGLSHNKIIGVAVHVIGIKEDVFGQIKGYMQEFL